MAPPEKAISQHNSQGMKTYASRDETALLREKRRRNSRGDQRRRVILEIVKEGVRSVDLSPFG